MIMKIERDQRRFRQIVRGRIRKNLRKYITHGEMIGRKGRDLVSIPVPQLDVPHFRFGDNGAGGVGQGDGEEGQPIAKGGDPQDGSGQAGSDPGGGHLLEVDISLDELAAILGEELELPRIEPKGQASIVQEKSKYNSIRQTGPGVAAAFQTHLSARRCKRQISTGVYEPDDPRVIPIKADKQYRSWNDGRAPAGQRGRDLHDGRLRLDDRRAEGDRPHRGVLDRHLARPASTTASKRATSSTTRWPRKSTSTRSITPAKAAARGSARRTRRARDLIEEQFPPSEWNLYCFQFSDGDNWGEDNEEAFKILGEQLLPIANLFCYGQVESPYGSGEFLGLPARPLRRAPRVARALGNRRQRRHLRIDQNVSGQGPLSPHAA